MGENVTWNKFEGNDLSPRCPKGAKWTHARKRPRLSVTLLGYISWSNNCVNGERNCPHELRLKGLAGPIDHRSR